jgi:hypothetical protein
MRSFLMLPAEPVTRIDCAAVARAGLWSETCCCEACHRGVCADPLALEQDIGPGGVAGLKRVQLCCRAGTYVDLSKAFALRSESLPASR